MITYHLSLDYDLKAGWLAPFVAGLTRGEAMARACTDCGRVSFPRCARACAAVAGPSGSGCPPVGAS